jgi:PhnB protein
VVRKFKRHDGEGELKWKMNIEPPEGWQTVTPRIVTHDAKQFIEFLKQVFGAKGEYRQGLPSEVRIGDSLVMISDAGIRRPMTAFLYVYVNDTDATFQRALAAGARSIEEPTDQPYGDRRGMVEDNWGNNWQIATHMQPVSQSM